MPITPRELEDLVSWARAGPRRIRVKFKGYRFMLVIGRYVEAVDAAEKKIAWHVAFGSRPPHDVLSSLPIEEIVVEEAGLSKSFPSLTELLKYAGIKR